jgi:hypothetical protein
VQTELALGSINVRIINRGIGGKTTPQCISTAPTLIDPYYRSSALDHMMEGYNDIISNGLTGTGGGVTAYNNLVAYCQARQAVGWKVSLCTIGPSDVLTSGQDAARVHCNALLLADSATAVSTNIWKGATYCNILVDFWSDAALAPGAFPYNLSGNANYTTGGPHLTAAGQAIKSGYEVTAFESLGF